MLERHRISKKNSGCGSDGEDTRRTRGEAEQEMKIEDDERRAARIWNGVDGRPSLNLVWPALARCLVFLLLVSCFPSWLPYVTNHGHPFCPNSHITSCTYYVTAVLSCASLLASCSTTLRKICFDGGNIKRELKCKSTDGGGSELAALFQCVA